MSSLLAFLVSVCIAEFIHNAFEMWGIRLRVRMLTQSLQLTEYEAWPIKLSSKFQIALLHIALLILTTTISFFVLSALKLSNANLVIIGIVVLIINYFYTTFVVDRYHTEIGKLFKN